MLFKLLKRWLGAKAGGRNGPVQANALFERARDCMLAGDNQGAIQAYRAYLEIDPYNVTALNDMGACLVDTGDIAQAAQSLELAHSLDDTFVPVMVNYAKLLNDHYNRGEDALRMLRRAKITNPDFSHAEAVYAGVRFKRGEGEVAVHFQQRAWLANFDNLRLANGVMFWGSYVHAEARTAAEHRFWAETLKPLEALPPPPQPAEPRETETRIRIGYWSPDFRGHSVRFFFRPLLENHDRARFEVVLFHDCPLPDAQTNAIRAAAEHFHDVHEMPDSRLREFIREQRLDILVDLAGHTSFNRLSLMQDRLATLQLNALGYPPTTGLAEVDVKLIDRFTSTPRDADFYAERPMVLPGSFWCYDPMEEVAEPAPPPAQANGYVTFGCVGNIAKITTDLLAGWKRILERVSTARLVLRAINFEDEIAVVAMQEALARAGIDASRVDLLRPKGGKDFYDSYNAIDIVLDTFPFNGGTTTCFATYMGVPVVTQVGESLVGRMGLSVMSNLGAPEFAVATLDAYVERAVAAANDIDFLARFRREVRGRLRSTALGNGRLFAGEFEAACAAMLAEKKAGTFRYVPTLAPLPESELMRRAYAVVRRGQVDAAERISAYCLRCYPRSGKPHLLKTQLLVWGRAYQAALDYLDTRWRDFAPEDQTNALLVIVRLHLTNGDLVQARAALALLSQRDVADPFDRLQIDFYAACIAQAPPVPERAEGVTEKVLFVVPCDDAARFDAQRGQIEQACECPAGWTIDFLCCDEDGRIAAYEGARRRGDVTMVVLVQKNVEIHNYVFLRELQHALLAADIVACAGAWRSARLDWRLDAFEHKTGSFIAASSEREGMVEVHWFGDARDCVAAGLAVLDGSVLAFRPGAAFPEFAADLLGAATLLEEAWSHAAGQGGLRLGVHRNLGVYIDATIALDERDRTEARVSYALERDFDPFADTSDDFLSVSAPVADAAAAVAVCRAFLAAA